MFPVFNPGPFDSNGNPASSAQQQAMVNPYNFPPNPLQFQQQTISPQMTMPYNYSVQSWQQAPLNFTNPPAIGDFYSQISQNPAQLLNQNLNLGLGFPNQVHGINQLLQLAMSQFNGQVVPGNRNMPPNLPFDANSLVQFGCNGGMGQLPFNNQIPFATQRDVKVQAFGPCRPQGNLENLHSAPGISKGHGKNASQDPKVQNGGSPKNKKRLGNPKCEGSGNRFSMQQTRRNPGFHNFRSKAGNDGVTDASTNFVTKTPAEKKRSIALNYTEQEIKQWQNERKKNYPTKDNIEKKLKGNLEDPETSKTVAESRRQQLREILAKQAELGCEVAEVPSSYLADQDAATELKETGRASNRKRKFQNKFSRRARFKPNKNFTKESDSLNHKASQSDKQEDSNQNQRLFVKRGSRNLNQSRSNQRNDHSKKPRLVNGDSVGAGNKREPSLLSKLLRSDIRRDKRSLLQVFRFMAMNSFFKDWPEKPLKFPQVAVWDTTDEICLNERNPRGGNKGRLEEIEESMVNPTSHAQC